MEMQTEEKMVEIKKTYEINKTFEAHSLEEVISQIQSFSEGELVWFRGHKSCAHKLLPTLYRDKKVDFLDDKGYNSMHMAEQVRIQQYYAKDYPFIKDSGHNTIEWLGMGQHFGMNTRFLDWSVSALHSTVFALYDYFENQEYEGTDIPCLWVLRPQEMNKRVVEQIFSREWTDAYRDIYGHDVQEQDKLIELEKNMKKAPDMYRKIFMESNPNNKWGHMDYIYNISYFDRLLEMMKANPKLTFSQNIINPIFLFLAMTYIDGANTKDEVLGSTPLAVIHPMNSERIREQRGVFTVFPFPDSDSYEKAGNSLEYMRMEWNPKLKGTLCKIVLLRPRKICEEMRRIGIHRSWLFNEPEYITKEIESGL